MRFIRLLLIATTLSCTPLAKSTADTTIQVAVDTCQEVAPALNNPFVDLVCAIVVGGAPVAHVIIDSNVWNELKVKYKKEHGRLPAGTSEPR
jgi:hypothetical protein